MAQSTLRGKLVGALASLMVLVLGCSSGVDSPLNAGPEPNTMAALPDGVKAFDIKSVRAALPRGWRMSAPKTVAAPHGYARQEGMVGVKIVFTGPRHVEPPRRAKSGPGGNEEFTLWIMPAGYSAALPDLLPQTNASLLGRNDDFQVFYIVGTTSVPTWESWQRDLAFVLGLKDKA